MSAARSKADENRQRFDELDKEGEAIRTQLDSRDTTASRFYAVRIFIRAAIAVIIVVTLLAWWLMRDTTHEHPASASDAAMSDVKSTN